MPRLLLFVTPGLLAAAVFLALAFFQTEPKDVALVTAALAGVSEAERKMDTPALTLRKRSKWGREHVVKVMDRSAEFDVGRDGKKLLRIEITAETSMCCQNVSSRQNVSLSRDLMQPGL